MNRIGLFIFVLLCLSCDPGYREWPLEFIKIQDCETISNSDIQKPDILLKDGVGKNYYLRIRGVGREIIGEPNTNFSWQSKSETSLTGVTKIYQHNASFTFENTITGFYLVSLNKICSKSGCELNRNMGCLTIYSIVNKNL